MGQDQGSEVVLSEQPISVNDYQRLRRSAGWYCVDDEATREGLALSLFQVCAIRQDDVIGFGRVVGDRRIHLYIQDIVVLPEFQRQGIGHRIMDRVIGYVRSVARPNTFVGLMAARGFRKFYEPYGFRPRPADAPGMFLVWPGRLEPAAPGR